MGRWVGVDYGTRRIGIALCDPGESIASPVTTLPARPQPAQAALLVLQWAAQHEASGLVVGLPLNMDGSDSAQTSLTRQFAEQLRRHGELPVELWDERLTSLQADALMRAAATRRSRRKRRRDALAAQLILQSFLDARR